MEPVASAQNKYFKLEIHQDDDNESPREYDNLGTFITWDRGYNSPDTNDYRTPDDFLEAWHDWPGGVLLPVFKFEHGGVAYRTTDFGDKWDSGQVGFIFASAEDIAKNWGEKVTDSEWFAQHYGAGSSSTDAVLGILVAEVEEYSMWANGESYGYILSEWKGNHDGEDEYEEIESCWGFLGSVGLWASSISEADDPHVAELIAQVG
jgi:hypothetical protein